MKFDNSNPFNTQAKLFHHREALFRYLTEDDTPGPVFVEVNPSNNCNLACNWCFCSCYKRDNANLDVGAFRNFVADFVRLGGKAITFAGGGEPTMHPEFPTLLQIVRDARLDVGLITNGVFSQSYCSAITSTCKWVRVSLDAANEKDFLRMKGARGATRSLVNIRSMYARKDGCKVGVCCNISDDHTLDNITELINTVQDMCDYVQFRPVLPRLYLDEGFELHQQGIWEYLEKMNFHKVILSRDKVADALDHRAFSAPCEGHFFNPILNADNKLMVCMYHPEDERFTFGDISKDSLAEIWKSERRRSVIAWLREQTDYASLNCQPCCKLTETNKVIAFLKNADKLEDVNFL